MMIRYKGFNIFAFSDTHGKHEEVQIPPDTDIPRFQVIQLLDGRANATDSTTRQQQENRSFLYVCGYSGDIYRNIDVHG